MTGSHIIARRLRAGAALALVLGSLAACGGGNNGTTASTPTTTVTSTRPEDQIGGSAFGTSFRNDPNAVATEPGPNDVPAVDPTKAPQPI